MQVRWKLLLVLERVVSQVYVGVNNQKIEGGNKVAEITDVRIYKTKIVGKQKAFVAVTLDGEFTVHGIKVMEKDDDTLWVSFPARKDASGEFRDIFHPITKEAREKINRAVLEAYEHRT